MEVPRAMTPKQAVDRLTEMSYFKFLSDSEYAVAQSELVVLMQDILAREGVSFQSVADDFDDESEDQAYAVVIDGRRYPIHDASILQT